MRSWFKIFSAQIDDPGFGFLDQFYDTQEEAKAADTFGRGVIQYWIGMLEKQDFLNVINAEYKTVLEGGSPGGIASYAQFRTDAPKNPDSNLSSPYNSGTGTAGAPKKQKPVITNTKLRTFASLAQQIAAMWGVLYGIPSYRNAGYPLDRQIKLVLSKCFDNTVTDADVNALFSQMALYGIGTQA